MFFGIKAICASSCSCFLLFKRINAFSFFSTGPTKDYDQGMAGSLKRARKGVEAQSYHWYASFSVDLLNASPSPDLCLPSFEQSAGFMITEYFRFFFFVDESMIKLVLKFRSHRSHIRRLRRQGLRSIQIEYECHYTSCFTRRRGVWRLRECRELGGYALLY